MYLELLNKLLWLIAISLILINSIYLSIKLKFPQFKIIKAIKGIKNKSNKKDISPTDTLIMTLSSKIGVGSLSGTALCIYYGGIGTIFWMYISSFILAIINYVENALAIIYKDKENNKSGPPYYITKGLNNKKLAIIYSLLIIISYIFLFTSIQTNTISTLSNEILSTNKVLISVFVTLFSSIIILKGINTISSICNKIFPFMMFIFILTGTIIMCKEIDTIPKLALNIINEAFNKNSISGGIIYTIIITFQRSVFASEAGVGTSSIISGSTSSNDYRLQARLGIISTYFIHFVVLGFTSLIIATSNINNINLSNGIELTKASFSYHLGLPGEFILITILVLFSFSTIITIYYYGESCLSFLTKSKKATILLKLLTIISIFLGGIIKANNIWNLIDIFLALLTIINMYAIFKLRKKIISKLIEK